MTLVVCYSRYKRKLDGGIKIGQLTTLGMQQCYDVGLMLKRRYMYQNQLINHMVSKICSTHHLNFYLSLCFLQHSLVILLNSSNCCQIKADSCYSVL